MDLSKNGITKFIVERFPDLVESVHVTDNIDRMDDRLVLVAVTLNKDRRLTSAAHTWAAQIEQEIREQFESLLIPLCYPPLRIIVTAFDHLNDDLAIVVTPKHEATR